MYITVPLADMRSQPGETGPLISQLLLGEEVRVVNSPPPDGGGREAYGAAISRTGEGDPPAPAILSRSAKDSASPIGERRSSDWTLVENIADRHKGYVRTDSFATGEPPTHAVTMLKVELHRDADAKSPILGHLSFMSRVTVLESDGFFARTPEGYIADASLELLDELHASPVDKARMFLNVPYVWGGRSYLGIDCSGLIQLSDLSYGVTLPRNAGPQAKVLDKTIPVEMVIPGDLAFVAGHVMMISGHNRVIHADGKVAMKVREMNLDEALADRGFSRADAIFKQSPNPDIWPKKLRKFLGEDWQGTLINRTTFAALSGPDIMS